MKTLFILTIRNIKIFFKDKAMFFCSLITPIILLVLYVFFLRSVYVSNFKSYLPDGFEIEESLINGIVGGQLISSLLATSIITVCFSSNMVMIYDKSNRNIDDFNVTPINKSVLSLSYFLSTFVCACIIALTGMLGGFIYIGIVGWYLSFVDVLLVILNVLLLVLFGTSLSSLCFTLVKTQGQATAISTIVSAGYGFVCGAYMPISGMSDGLKNTMMFLPSTYGTSLTRNPFMRGVFVKLSETNIPNEVIDQLKLAFDCNITFFDNGVPIYVMYLVLIGSTIILLALFILSSYIKQRRKR